MSDNSKIEWTDATWNPTRGCVEVSAGCDHCYARKLVDGRLKHHHPGGFENVMLLPDRLDQPLRWRRPRRIFVNSLSDLFHDQVPDDYIARVFAVMAATPEHTYQVLTKRHGRMRALLSRGTLGTEGFADDVENAMGEFTHASLDHWPLPNVWLGVSVEDQKWADIRIPALLDTPAAVRFLSCEPLLGPIDLTSVSAGYIGGNGAPARRSALTTPCARCGGWGIDPCKQPDVHFVNRGGIHPCVDWVIVGGESGPKARPMHPQWARDLRDQCADARVPYFMKQWGDLVTEDQSPQDIVLPSTSWRLLGDDGPSFYKVGKKRAGRELDGRTWDEFPAGVR